MCKNIITKNHCKTINLSLEVVKPQFEVSGLCDNHYLLIQTSQS